jgi:hypothetical protein
MKFSTSRTMKHKFVLITWILTLWPFYSPDVSAQWAQTNGLNGSTITSFATIGTTIFAGTEKGVYVSNDSGLNWANDVPDSPKYIYALATIGQNLFAGTYGYGVFLSTDKSQSWLPANNGLTDPSVFALAVVGSNIIAGGEGGLFSSSNNGSSWISSNNGLPGNPVVTNMTAIGSNLFVDVDYGGGVFLSENSSGWIRANSGLPGGYGNAFGAVGSNLFAGTYDSGIYLSKNDGIDWVSSGLGGYNVSAIETVGSNIFAGGFNGIFLSTDSGENWMPVDDGLTNMIVDAFAVIGNYILVGTGNAANWNGNGVWRRPLSDMIGSDSVELASPLKNSITAYPNPFSSSISFSFSSSESGMTQISIVNLLGTEIARIYSGMLGTGVHNFTWSNTSSMKEGMYECLIRMNGQVESVPLVLDR